MSMEDELTQLFTEEDHHAPIDDAIDEVEDAAEDITSGDSIDDGHMIDTVALADVKVDSDVKDIVKDDEEDIIGAVQHGIDPDDVGYETKYPELHDCDEDDYCEDEDIDEEDLAEAIDECIVNMATADIVLEALSENAEEG